MLWNMTLTIGNTSRWPVTVGLQGFSSAEDGDGKKIPHVQDTEGNRYT